MPFVSKGISNQADIVEIGPKRCAECKKVKPSSEFRHRMKRGKVRARSKCRECEKSDIQRQNRDYYERHSEQLIVDAKQWRIDNLDRYNEWQRDYQHRKHHEWKQACMDHYGQICACPGCDITHIAGLTLDHVNNDGHLHRKEIKERNLYEWLYMRGFPEDYAIQVLCFTCNFAKRYNGGTCPIHPMSEGSTTRA